METIELLLDEIKVISGKYEDIMVQTGEGFNVFEILNLEANETRTHSAFLKALLNPKGKHGLRDTMLKLFLERIDYKELDIATARVDEKERVIGGISEDYNEGGRIDIIIEDNLGHGVIIENKIYASDQEKQLVRYFNHAKREYPKGFKLIYLNLHGTKPSQSSIEDGKNVLIAGVDFDIISYKSDIISWLEACKIEAVDLPILRETIKQYIFLLDKLTNQSTNHKMKEEIKTLLIEDLEKFRTAKTIKESFENIKTEMAAFIRSEFKKEEIIYESKNRDCYIKLIQEDDGEYYFFGFRAYHKDGTDYDIRSPKFSTFYEAIKNVDKKLDVNKHVWITLKAYKEIGNKKTEQFDDDLLFNLYNTENSRNSFFQSLYDEAECYKRKFLDILKDNNPFESSSI
ncbi:PD-(D/E)XK nuclease family protein [Parasediminibacterium paludis]|uniref:PD-(D/E)XK nuclease family protein n=1 Tax=Parasediminibacterium paludis TaxID=908966 RepID=A0ABV8PUQ8_9BACT